MGCFIGGRGTVEVGVDFVDDTVEEEIVMALPEDGGMSCFGAGVGGFVDELFVGLAGRVGFAVEVSGGGFETMTSWWTGLRMSSTWALFRGIIGAVSVIVVLNIVEFD